MYVYLTVLQKFTKLYTLSPIGRTVSSFADREQVAPNLIPNQYCGVDYRNDPKFSDSQALANSADPDQTTAV